MCNIRNKLELPPEACELMMLQTKPQNPKTPKPRAKTKLLVIKRELILMGGECCRESKIKVDPSSLDPVPPELWTP